MLDIARAEKKLRQAEFFLSWLEHTSKEEMVKHLANPRNGNPEQLEYFFSACLSAAQSVYNILTETGGARFREVQKEWRARLPEGDRFGRMIGLRGHDVHLGETGVEALPKYVKEEPWERSAVGSYYNNYNAALFGPAPVFEHENPDGTKVVATVMRGSLGLYLDWGGRRVDAATVCRDFICLLRSLLEATKAAAGTVSAPESSVLTR
jgi:hypothetical protein